jgi:uncharacterized membrane protein (UPF0127 family)
MAAVRVAVAMVAVLLAWGGPGGAVAQPAAPVSFAQSTVEIVSAAGPSHTFAVELAVSQEQLEQGLMFRRSLAADAGMLFDFGRVEPVSMWMKNTLIPLDMIFIAADGRIVDIAERTVPGSLAVIAARQPVRAVLEVNGGTAARLGLQAGDRVRHPIFGN